MAEFKNVGAAWKKNTTKGSDYISIKLNKTGGGAMNFSLFPNKLKKAANQPDFIVSMDAGIADSLGISTEQGSPNQSKNRVYPKNKGNDYPKESYQPKTEEAPAAPAAAPEAAADGASEPF